MDKNKNSALGVHFPLFLSIWNKFQDMNTPDIHFRMADALETAWESQNKKLLLLAFRSSGKSTITGLFAAWLLYQNPDLRILVLAADLPLAKKMVRQIRRIVEKHPLTGHLLPKRLTWWSDDRFTVKRKAEWRDPSVLARGITGNMTGSRADIVICDDVEVPNTCDTAEKRQNLRERLSETEYVLVPGGMQLYLGTPHTWDSIYKEDGFLKSFQRFEMPILDKSQKSTWPERFTTEHIRQIKIATGPNKFDSQMMLKPVNIMEGRLNASRLRRYEDEIDYTKEINLLQISDQSIVSASAWWDPSTGKSGSDSSVLAVVYSDENGNHYLHHVAYLNPKQESTQDDDLIEIQCEQVARITKEFMLPAIVIENNGMGQLLPNILRKTLHKEKVPTAVIEFTNTRSKDLRILEAFDALLDAGRLHVHRSVYSTPFITEMREWRPGISGQKDDGLDAVAGALSREPVRLKSWPRLGQWGWTEKKRSPVCEADTGWNV